MADKVAVMYQGRLVEYGDTDAVMHHPQKEYTRRLINAYCGFTEVKAWKNTGSKRPEKDIL